MGTLVSNGSLTEEEVFDALYEAAVINGDVQKHGGQQTRNTINSGLQAGFRAPRPLLKEGVLAIDISAMSDRKIADISLHSEEVSSGRPWPSSLNGDAYTGIAGEFIRLVAPQTEGDPCALLIAFLTVIGSMVGRGAYMEIGATRHYADVFLVIVAETSKGRKGTVMAEAKRFAKMMDPNVPYANAWWPFIWRRID